jgi:hypothetical protein
MSLKGSLSLPGWESTAGENHRGCRVTDDGVREIRKAKDQIELAILAKKYGLSLSYTERVWKRLARKGVK